MGATRATGNAGRINRARSARRVDEDERGFKAGCSDTASGCGNHCAVAVVGEEWGRSSDGEMTTGVPGLVCRRGAVGHGDGCQGPCRRVRFPTTAEQPRHEGDPGTLLGKLSQLMPERARMLEQGRRTGLRGSERGEAILHAVAVPEIGCHLPQKKRQDEMGVLNALDARRLALCGLPCS